MIARLISFDLVSSITTEVPQRISMTDFEKHRNKDYDNLKNTSKYTSIHDLNDDCAFLRVGQDDINASRASSSCMIPAMSLELRSGSAFVTDLLLHKHLTGITASPFIGNLDVLQKSVSLHGIVVYGLSHDEYKSILLRHIFGGGCVQGPDNNDRTACRHFAQNFTSPREMTQFAFEIISTAESTQRSTDELLFLFRALELTTAFKPRNLR